MSKIHLKETIEQAIFESYPGVKKRGANVPPKVRWNIFLKIKKSFRAEIGRLSEYSASVRIEELKTDNKKSTP